jgi:mxaK protein
MEKRIIIWLNNHLLQAFPWVLLISFLSLLGMLWSGTALYKAKQYHHHLHNHTLQNNVADDAIFADAVYWVKQGNNEKALKLYAQAISSPDLNIRKTANYNMANIYLREANKLLETTGLESWDKVTPLLSMAKEGYREALRLDPDWVNAKYNYELALRIAPTIESKHSRQTPEDEELKDQESAPEGWPAIPGFPRGMP